MAIIAADVILVHGPFYARFSIGYVKLPQHSVFWVGLGRYTKAHHVRFESAADITCERHSIRLSPDNGH